MIKEFSKLEFKLVSICYYVLTIKVCGMASIGGTGQAPGSINPAVTSQKTDQEQNLFLKDIIYFFVYRRCVII